MTCFHPITVWKQNTAFLDIPPREYYESKKISFRNIPTREKIEIPCGHCIGCKLDHASMWATRITMESKCWKFNCFVTLTYNNPNLPLSEKGLKTLKKKDLQDFLKRLRYYEEGKEEWAHPITGEIEKPIRYFACGEYGDKKGRPHYHLAIFNWQPDDLKKYKMNKYGDQNFTSKSLKKIWGKGFVVVEELNFNTASYIARYVLKKAGIEAEKREYTGKYRYEQRIDERNGNEYTHKIREVKTKKTEIEKEFITMSRGVGIGRTYWNDNKEKIKRNKGILLKVKDKVKLKPIPRYFKKLWEQENWEEYYRYKYEKQKDGIKTKIEIINRISLPDGTSNEEKWEFYLDNQEKTLKQHLSKYKRTNAEESYPQDFDS